jgi:hypothetical protein
VISFLRGGVVLLKIRGLSIRSCLKTVKMICVLVEKRGIELSERFGWAFYRLSWGAILEDHV